MKRKSSKNNGSICIKHSSSTFEDKGKNDSACGDSNSKESDKNSLGITGVDTAKDTAMANAQPAIPKGE